MKNRNFFMEKCMEKRMQKGIHRAIFGFLHFIVGAAVLAAVGYVVMLLWNCLVPEIIGWKAVGYWQALGLLALCKLLFGGVFGGKHKWGKGGFGHHHNNPMREKWQKMTPEERKEFVNKMRCGQHDFFQQTENEKSAAE